MSAKYHINNRGEAGKCTADSGYCPFGSTGDHYDKPEDARIAYEKKMNSKSVPKSTRESIALDELDRDSKKLSKLQEETLRMNQGGSEPLHMSDDEIRETVDLISSVREKLTDDRWETTKKVNEYADYEKRLAKEQDIFDKESSRIAKLDNEISERPSILTERIEARSERIKRFKEELAEIKEEFAEQDLSSNERDDILYQSALRQKWYKAKGFLNVAERDKEAFQERLEDLKSGEHDLIKNRNNAAEKLAESNGKLDEIRSNEPEKVTDEDQRTAEAYKSSAYLAHRASQKLLRRDISDEELKKIASTKPQQNDYRLILFGPDSHELIYRHQNASEETKEIAASNSKNVRMEKKIDGIQNENENVLKEIVSNADVSQPYGKNRGYSVTTLKIDKDKIKSLGLNAEEEARLVRRIPSTGQSRSYNQKTGVFTVTLDSTD